MRKHYTLLISVIMAMTPVLGLAQDMPDYCSGTAPNNYEGNHYGASAMTLKVNGVEAFKFSGLTENISNLVNDYSADINPGDELTVTLSGGSHMQWGVGLCYVDWNADGEFSADETITIFENVANGDLSEYVSGTMFSYTGKVTVPQNVAKGSFALRINSGEAYMHNNISYDPCTVCRRGKMITVRLNNGGASEEPKGWQTVVVIKNDGSTVAVQGEKDFFAKMADGELRFESSKGYIAIPLDEVKRWVYSTEPGDAEWASISAPSVASDVIVKRLGNVIMLENLPAGSHVGLVALNGVTLLSAVASESYKIDLSDMESGLYLLTFNNQTIKIAVSR